MAEISVIVPVYKVEKYLNRCVESILAQSFQDYELILVDDGSPDRCGQMCDRFAEKDSRIRVIHQVNGGLSAARNTGIDRALSGGSTKWLTFIDSDDWIHPRYLEILYQTALRYHVAVSVAGHLRKKEKGDASPAQDSDTSMKAEGDIGLAEPIVEICTPQELLLRHPWDYNYAWGKLYARGLFRTLRYPEGKNFEDTFTTYRALAESGRIAWIDQALYYYFYNPQGISAGLWTPSELAVLEGMRQQMNFYRKKGWEEAYRAEEKLYIHHHAYQMVRIRQNQKDLKQNRGYLRSLRRQMIRMLRRHPDRYGFREMTYCYEAAWPRLTALRHLAGRLRRRIW